MNELFKDAITTCYDSYSKNEEDTTSWIDYDWLRNSSSSVLCPENWEYSANKQTYGFDTWGRFAVYSGGGYVANLGYNERTATQSY